MAEIYVNSNGLVKTTIFYNEEPTNASGSVVAKIYDVTGDISISPSINPATLLSTITATVDENNSGSYQAVIPYSLTDRNKKLKVVWEYSIASTALSHQAFLNVVTPYSDLSEAVRLLQLSSDSSDPGFKSYTELMIAEKYARNIIEQFTGQEFKLSIDTEVAYGTGSDILPLPKKINTIYKLYANDVLLINNLSTPAVNNWGYVPIITENGFGIRLDKTTFLDNTVYLANGMVPPTINDDYSGQAFRNGIRYRVVGKFGWSSVPDDVQQACIQLMGQYWTKDRSWADRYLKTVSTFDWDFEYRNEVHSGTGSAYVDKLLSDYVVDKMVLI